jgi:DNA-directed RNA polymerase II subunit RPB2
MNSTMNTSKSGFIDVASLYLRNPNVMVEDKIEGYLKSIKEDIPNLLKENNEIFTAKSGTETKIISFVVDQITIDFSPKVSYQDIIDLNMSPTYKVWGVVKQQILTKNHLTNETSIETMASNEPNKAQIVCEIPVMLFDREQQKLYSSLFDVQGVILHKGAPITLLPYDTFVENKAICLVRKISSTNAFAIDICSVDFNKPTVMQRYSISYRKQYRRSNFSLAFTFSMFRDEVPIVVILMALGMTNHTVILDYISQDIDVRKMFMSSLTEAKFTKLGKEETMIVSQEDAYEELASMLKVQNREYNTAVKLYLKNIMERNILPHIRGSQHAKAAYLCTLINRLLLVSMGREGVDNRDSYNFKRLASSRHTFMQIYASSKDLMIREIRKTAKKIIRDDMLFDEHQEIPDLTTHVKFSMMSKSMTSALNVGFWKKSQYHSPKTVSDSLKNVNNVAEAFSMMRKLPAPSNLENNSNYGPRLVIGDHQGYVCIYSTPEGKQIGLTKELACSVKISNGNEECIDPLKKRLLEMSEEFGIVAIDSVKFKDFYWDTKIFIFGDLIGCTRKGFELYQKLREMRFDGEIVRDHVGIVLDRDELHINPGQGRMYRPFLVVRDGRISLPSEAFERIRNKKIESWIDLLKEYPRDIEYLDTEEYTLNALVASTEDDLRVEREKVEYSLSRPIAEDGDEILISQYTHCEIHPIFSLSAVAGTIPFSNHNQSPKNMAQWRMRKQAIATLANNKITNRTRKYELWFPQRPLSSTFVSRELNLDTLPSGENIYVSICSYYGGNQEDSVLMNSSSIERGMFRASFTRLYVDSIDSNSDSFIGTFKKPNMMEILMKKNINFKTLSDDGYAAPGTYVDGDTNDALINKQIPVVNVNGGLPYKNIQVKMRRGEGGVVENVLKGVNVDGNKFIKLTVSSERVPEIGDKFASRAGQKGTIGDIYHQAYMPTTGGLVADLVLNPHMLPSRMTTGQLLECMVSKYANNACDFVDATPYQGLDLEDLRKKMKGIGFDEFGREKMICGFTGKPMENLIFFGPTYYQRLRHMVADKVNARGFAGPVTQTTRQPTDGRAHDGGYKVGEMERDGLLAHGVATTMRQLFTVHSDGKLFNVCKNVVDGAACGTFTHHYDTDTTTGKPIYICPTCKSCIDSVQVSIPYTFKLLIQLMFGMKVRVRVLVDTHSIE